MCNVARLHHLRTNRDTRERMTKSIVGIKSWLELLSFLAQVPVKENCIFDFVKFSVCSFFKIQLFLWIFHLFPIVAHFWKFLVFWNVSIFRNFLYIFYSFSILSLLGFYKISQYFWFLNIIWIFLIIRIFWNINFFSLLQIFQIL